MEPLEPTSSSNEELPRQNLKVVGPMGWSADQGGRPATQLGPPTFPFFCWAAFGSHLSMVEVWAFVMLNFFFGGDGNVGSQSSVRFWITIVVFGERHTDPALDQQDSTLQS